MCDIKRFEKRAELGEFLSRQRIRDNGAIPHQIHQYELEKIIDNQAAHYSFLAQNRDKIISIFTFKLPYYIGPLKRVAILLVNQKERRRNLSVEF